jgi:uncharacterized membrane protein
MSSRPRQSPASSDSAVAGTVEELTQANVERVSALEAAEREKASVGDRVASAVTTFCGSLTFVWINLAAMAGWVVLNVALPPSRRVDPFPFALLTLFLSVEAIVLSIFILITQNRDARVTEKRSHLDLQLNLLSEQENTRMLLLLERIGQAVGAELPDDGEEKVLSQATEPEALSEQIDKAVERKERGREEKE